MIKIYVGELVYEGPREDIPDRYKARIAMLDAVNFEKGLCLMEKEIPGVGESWFLFSDEPKYELFEVEEE